MTQYERARKQFEQLMRLWWRCVTEQRVRPDKRPAIEEEFESIAAALGVDFYRTPPEEGRLMFLPLTDTQLPRSVILRTSALLASLNPTLRKQLAERAIDPKEYSWQFFDGMTEFEYASIPNKVTPVTLTTDQDAARLLKPVVSTDEYTYRPALRQVQFHAALQRAVASDGSLIVVLPWKVKGKVSHYLFPTRETKPDSRLVFPDWERAIPLRSEVESAPIPMERLLPRIPGLLNLTRVFNWHLGTSAHWFSIRGVITIGTDLTIAVDSLQFSKTLTVLAGAGTTRIVLRASSPLRPVLLVDADDPRRFACLFAQKHGELVGRLLSVATATTDPPEFTGLTRN